MQSDSIDLIHFENYGNLMALWSKSQDIDVVWLLQMFLQR